MQTDIEMASYWFHLRLLSILTLENASFQAGKLSNRLFYLSIPPSIFVDVVRCATLGLNVSSANGWTMVVIEKAFDRYSKFAPELTLCLKHYLMEDQIFKIDHCLNKELVENLSRLKFPFFFFLPLWQRIYIHNMQLIYSEDFGADGIGVILMNFDLWRIFLYFDMC